MNNYPAELKVFLDKHVFNIYSNHIIIIQQNISSMRRNVDLFISKLHALEKAPQIIILTEIWICDSELSQYSLPQYKIYAKCNNDYRAGGVAVLVAESLTCDET